MSIKGKSPCPACGKGLAPSLIHEHTSVCEPWIRTIGAPWPKILYSRNLPLFKFSAQEDTDFVRCYICNEHGWDFRFRRMLDHLKKGHKISEAQYLERYPGRSVRLSSTTERRKASVRKLYGVDFCSQVEESKQKSRETCLNKYGTERASQSEVIKAKATATNLEKYGYANPFEVPEFKEKMKATSLRNYGFEHPNQSPEMQAKRVDNCAFK